MNILCTLWLVVSLQAAPPQQMPPGAVEGTVLRMGSNDAISGADVELTQVATAAVTPDPSLRSGLPNAAAPGTSKVTTSDDGRFVFSDLAPGRYRLVATHSGGTLSPAEYGQHEPKGQGTTFEVTSGSRVTGVQLVMAPTGAITGRITDGDDEPVANARVMALESVYRNGQRTLNIVEAVRTNDLGVYRLFWLLPGRYYVGVVRDDQRAYSFSLHVVPPDQHGNREDASSPVVRQHTANDGSTVDEITVPVYFGGGTDESRARAIDLGAGLVESAIDISVADGIVVSRRVKGKVVGSDGAPAAGAIVRLVPAKPSPHAIIPNTLADRQGAFVISGVAPGAYTLVSTKGAGSGWSFNESLMDISQGASTTMPLEVSGRDIDNLTIVLGLSYTVNGRVYIEGSTPLPAGWDATRVHISAVHDPNLLGLPVPGAGNPRPGQQRSGVPLDDGSFIITSLSSGMYRVNVDAIPSTGYVKAVQWGGVNVLQDGMLIRGNPNAELSILINLDGGSIHGVTVNDKGEPYPNARVVLVPDAPLRGASQLYKSTYSGASGTFRINGIVPGRYKVFVWESIISGAWLNPDFIRDYEVRGTSVTVSSGDPAELQLKVVPN